MYADHECACDTYDDSYFCTAKKCRNNIHVSSPSGSTTIGHVGTDEGSPRNAINPTRSTTSPQTKPSDQRDEQEFTELFDMLPEIMSDSIFSTDEAILTSLRFAGEIIKYKQNVH